jgi:hypothetical protein
VQVVAEGGQRRDQLWPAVEEVADQPQLGALCGDVRERLFCLVGPATAAAGKMDSASARA